jgi:uncharacterized protein (TIGR02453 family)
MNHYSKKSLAFLKKAAKQKKPEWLDKNKAEYLDVLVQPTQYLGTELQKRLGPLVRGYKFPKRYAIIKRNSLKAKEHGWYKNWIAIGAERPSGSLFEQNPGLYFHVSGTDIFCGGGLYMATSQQTRKIREWINHDPTKLQELFSDKKFKSRFKDFSDSKKLKTFPRGFDLNHPHIEWLRLQAFYVHRNYTQKQLFSKNFIDILHKDFEQILRLNQVLDFYLQAWTGKSRAVVAEKDFDLALENFR